MNLFKKIILNLKLKLKMEKTIKTIKLRKCTPAGKPSSNNAHMGKDDFFVIKSKFECNKNDILRVYDGTSCGWVYDYEIDSLITIEELEAEKEIAKASVEALQTKIDWLNESGNLEFDEEEFKVYSTLKLLEKTDLTITEKSKLIAELIKGSPCK